MLTSIDRSFEFWFYVPLALDTKQAISETLLQANLLAWYGKSKSNTTKARVHHQEKCTITQNKHQKKLKLGVVAFTTSGLETEQVLRVYSQRKR